MKRKNTVTPNREYLEKLIKNNGTKISVIANACGMSQRNFSRLYDTSIHTKQSLEDIERVATYLCVPLENIILDDNTSPIGSVSLRKISSIKTIPGRLKNLEFVHTFYDCKIDDSNQSHLKNYITYLFQGTPEYGEKNKLNYQLNYIDIVGEGNSLLNKLNDSSINCYYGNYNVFFIDATQDLVQRSQSNYDGMDKFMSYHPFFESIHVLVFSEKSSENIFYYPEKGYQNSEDLKNNFWNLMMEDKNFQIHKNKSTNKDFLANEKENLSIHSYSERRQIPPYAHYPIDWEIEKYPMPKHTGKVLIQKNEYEFSSNELKKKEDAMK